MASRLLLGRLELGRTAFFLCDIQERFRDLIYGFPSVVHTASTLLSASQVLGVPVVVTEQYPKGLGRTVKELNVSGVPVLEKTKFSMLTPAVRSMFEPAASLHGIESVVLCGLETHVCVQQTALDLLEKGVSCTLVADGVSSQRQLDRSTALERLRQAGCIVSTSESVLFELMRDANFQHFRSVSALVKAANETRPTGEHSLSRL